MNRDEELLRLVIQLLEQLKELLQKIDINTVAKE